MHDITNEVMKTSNRNGFFTTMFWVVVIKLECGLFSIGLVFTTKVSYLNKGLSVA